MEAMHRLYINTAEISESFASFFWIRAVFSPDWTNTVANDIKIIRIATAPYADGSSNLAMTMDTTNWLT